MSLSLPVLNAALSESSVYCCLPAPVPRTQPGIMLLGKLGTAVLTCINPSTREAEAGGS